MSSNKPQKSAQSMAKGATAFGAVIWVLSMFTTYAIIPSRGLYAVFALISVVMLLVHLKIAKMSREVEGDPLKKTVTLCIAGFALQLVFFGVLVILGPMDWVKRVFMTVAMFYMLFPVFLYYAAKKHHL